MKPNDLGWAIFGNLYRVHVSHSVMKTLFYTTGLIAMFSGFIIAPCCFGATTTVMVGAGGGFSFSPARITNHVGDSIQFVPTGISHSVSSNGNASQPFCGNATISSPCTITFNAAGVFGFKCIPHFTFGMTGMVVVLPTGNTPPTVAMTDPANGAVLASSLPTTLRATASDSDGTITQVQFFAGTSRLGISTSTTSPYSFLVPSIPTGNQAITAQATDNQGATTTSAAVNVTSVTPGPIRFDSSLVYANGQLPLTLSVTPGLSYAIEGGNGVAAWSNLVTFSAASNSFSYSNPVPPGEVFRLHRARLLPNP
jgi:plastocyanin